MKSFFTITILVGLLITFLFAISAFLGRDLFLTLQKEFEQGIINNGQSKKPLLVRFAVLSDTHSDSENTKKALEQAKSLGVEYIVHTGDWTTVGTVRELNEQKRIFDQEGIKYYGIMGDHDRWQSGDKNFEQVLGKSFESYDRDGIHNVLLDASDIENGLYKEELDWLEADLRIAGDKPILIFMHLPIYHPTSDRTISNKAGSDAERDSASERFLSLLKGKNILGIFSGDHHLSSNYTEPTTGVRIFISGAVTRERNLQKPRFSLVEVYKAHTISVTDQIIK